MIVISYTIKTLVQHGRQLDNTDNVQPKTYTVSRTYANVKALYECMLREYRADGVIVPPPPQLGSNALTTASTVAVASMTRNQNLTNSVVTDKRCLSLARYFNRIARHPLLRKDPTFRAFLQETDVPKALKSFGSLKAKDRWQNIVQKVLILRSKLTMKELDPWFQTRTSQLEETSRRLVQIKKNLKIMSSLKSRLALTSTSFRQNLLLLLVSRPSKEKDLRSVVHQAIESHKVMESIHEDQSQADDLIIQLSSDYIQMVKAAQDVLSRRRYLQQEVQRMKGTKPKPAKDDDEDEDDEDEEDEEDDDDQGSETATSVGSKPSVSKQMRKLHRRFESVSQTIRRELEHFDFVMKEEFENAFASYNSKYFKAIGHPVVLQPLPNHNVSAASQAVEYQEKHIEELE